VDDELAALGVPVDFYTVRTIASPTPTQGILDYAEANDVDLIVMGNRGMGKLRGALGSVSYGVLHRSDVPVLIMK
jgi:nucleotide-binding universal stress UspA family protein